MLRPSAVAAAVAAAAGPVAQHKLHPLNVCIPSVLERLNCRLKHFLNLPVNLLTAVVADQSFIKVEQVLPRFFCCTVLPLQLQTQPLLGWKGAESP